MRAALIILLCLHVALAWDADAGLTETFLSGSGATVTSTTAPYYVANSVDGDEISRWSSRQCLPILYFPNSEANALFDACLTPGQCSFTNVAGSPDIDLITDGRTDTKLELETSGGDGLLEINVPTPQRLQFINIYAEYGPGTTYLRLYNEQDSLVQEYSMTTADNYDYMPKEIPEDVIARITLEFPESIDLRLIAALAEQGCVETLTFDFGQEREVGGIKSLHHAKGEGLEGQVYLSTDNVTWTLAANIPAEANGSVSVNFSPITARFMKIVHKRSNAWYTSWVVHEIDAFGAGGLYGPAPAAVPNAASLREMFGVNGEWGWGTGTQSQDLDAGEGADIYLPIASHLRNTHGMDWDINDPDNEPDYDKMSAGGGTESKFWLNWDLEYETWVKSNNVTLDASLNFVSDIFPQSEWDDPDVSAHRYGQEFAAHFGPTNGTGTVTAAEVGNEPWGYDVTFYNEILKSMAKGLKDGDSNMIVMPAAFQANSKGGNDYIGAAITEDVASFLDGVNFHQHSYTTLSNGLRVETYPENPASDFNAIKNMIRWRNANMPTKAIWVTEWGWDSPGAGQECRYPECISEAAAATYATRGLMIQARYSVERSTWYNHANIDCDDHVPCRSGLTGDSNVNFEKKEVFLAFQGLLDVMGDAHFLDVLQEDEEAYVYAFGNYDQSSGDKVLTHIAAWRPIDADADHTSVQVSVSVDATPVETFCEDDTGFPACPSRQPAASSGGTMTLEVTARPMIVQVEETNLE